MGVASQRFLFGGFDTAKSPMFQWLQGTWEGMTRCNPRPIWACISRSLPLRRPVPAVGTFPNSCHCCRLCTDTTERQPRSPLATDRTIRSGFFLHSIRTFVCFYSLLKFVNPFLIPRLGSWLAFCTAKPMPPRTL